MTCNETWKVVICEKYIDINTFAAMLICTKRWNHGSRETPKGAALLYATNWDNTGLARQWALQCLIDGL